MISRVQQICDSYESGFGHGMAGDGLDLAHTQHSDAEMGEAYQIGYEAGRESRVVFSPDWLPENARLETQLREPQEHWQNLAAELLVRLIGLTSRPDEQEWAKAASEAATLLNTKRAASAEVAPQPAPAARKGIAAGLFQTPPQPTTGGGPLPQSATDMPVGKYGIAAAVARPKAKNDQTNPSGEVGSALHALTRSEQGRRAARSVIDGDPFADEKINLLAIAEISRRQGLQIDTDHMMSGALKKTGWSATHVITNSQEPLKKKAATPFVAPPLTTNGKQFL